MMVVVQNKMLKILSVAIVIVSQVSSVPFFGLGKVHFNIPI